MTWLYSKPSNEGYLLALIDPDGESQKASILLETEDFEPLGRIAPALADLSAEAQDVARQHSYRLVEGSRQTSDSGAGTGPDAPGHVASLREYTFADGSADRDRLGRHFRLLLSGAQIRGAIPALGVPAREGESRMGRSDARYELLSLVAERPVMLLGPRRSGKTSLLLWLVDDPPQRWAPVYLDLEKLVDPASLVVEMATAFADHPIIGPRIELPELNEGSTPPIASSELAQRRTTLYTRIRPEWLDVLDRLILQAAGDPPPLLLLDEFSDFLCALEGSPELEPFVNSAMPILSAGHTCNSVLTGSRSLEHQLERLDLGSAFEDFARFPLPPFDADDGRRLLSELLRSQQIRPSQAVIDRAMELVGHQLPFFIQMLAEHLACRVGSGDLEDVAIVESTYREELLGFPGQAYFNELERRLKAWNAYHLRRAGQQILRLLAERGRVSNDELRFRLGEQVGGSHALADLLAMLEEYFFVVPNGDGWALQAAVMRDYALRFYPPLPG